VEKSGDMTMRAFWLAILLSLAGCSSIDFDYPRTESTADFDTADTHLGKGVAALSASAGEGRSGFYPIGNGIDALSARLLLAERAERTIDTQYYLVKPDATGLAFLNALLRAADRGVRVRLLVDDVFAFGKDRGMAALDAHPNFEIRVVNPFRRGKAGFLWSGLTDFSRVTRRMHAKSFTVDSQVTILGGRNIADEYFGAREDAKFSDLDVVGIGPIAREVSIMFDSYWNHETALPLPAFADMPADPAAELELLRTYLASAANDIRGSRYAEAVKATVFEYIDGDGSEYEWSEYQLVYDSPDKHTRSSDGPAISINMPLADALSEATQELIILTPYFVLRRPAIEALVELQESGVQVTVVTNSLAANNHSVVHGHYAPTRKSLLRGGVRIYELRPDADVAGAEITAADDARATLHTKAFIVDRKTSFIGSFNFNQRSINRDSESGVIIESDEIGRGFAEAVDRRLQEAAWELFLDEKGRLRWRGYDDGRETIYTKDPQSKWGQRLSATLARILPVKDQL
jgi:putative cardiolipin synthase